MFSIIGILLVTYRGLFLIPITNPAEIKDGNVDMPIYGVLPMDNESDSERFSQSLESLIFNINTSDVFSDTNKCKTILYQAQHQKMANLSFLEKCQKK